MRWHAFAVAGLLTTLPVIVLDPAWGDQAELPRIFLDTTYAPPTTGITITVNGGDDLQAALNQAHPGDIIVLHAGATFIGNFILPNKPGTGWIYIRSWAHAGLPAHGTRVSPAQANLMPKIVTPNTAPAISTASAAHHYRFVGIEITGTHATTASTLFNLVRLEDQAGQVSLSQVPTDIVFDRCYIHGTPTGNVRRGIDLSSARAAVIDSYLSDFHEVGADSQALAGFNGPGPFKIVNNHLEGSGENVMFGGIDPSIPDLVPSDIEIRHNYFVKPLSWRIEDPSYGGTPWTVKNLFELKNARRVLIERDGGGRGRSQYRLPGWSHLSCARRDGRDLCDGGGASHVHLHRDVGQLDRRPRAGDGGRSRLSGWRLRDRGRYVFHHGRSPGGRLHRNGPGRREPYVDDRSDRPEEFSFDGYLYCDGCVRRSIVVIRADGNAL